MELGGAHGPEEGMTLRRGQPPCPTRQAARRTAPWRASHSVRMEAIALLRGERKNGPTVVLRESAVLRPESCSLSTVSPCGEKAPAPHSDGSEGATLCPCGRGPGSHCQAHGALSRVSWWH